MNDRVAQSNAKINSSKYIKLRPALTISNAVVILESLKVAQNLLGEISALVVFPYFLSKIVLGPFLTSVVHLPGNVSKVPLIFASEIKYAGLGSLFYFS